MHVELNGKGKNFSHLLNVYPIIHTSFSSFHFYHSSFFCERKEWVSSVRGKSGFFLWEVRVGFFCEKERRTFLSLDFLSICSLSYFLAVSFFFLLVLEHFTLKWFLERIFSLLLFKVRYPSSFRTFFFVSLLLPVFLPSLRTVSSHQYLVSFDEIVFSPEFFRRFLFQSTYFQTRRMGVFFLAIFSFILSHRLFSGKERIGKKSKEK